MLQSWEFQFIILILYFSIMVHMSIYFRKKTGPTISSVNKYLIKIGTKKEIMTYKFPFGFN